MKKKFTELRGRPVNQYTKDGAFVATHPSCAYAAESIGNKQLNGSIHQLCAGTFKGWKQALVGGFQWRFYEGNVIDIKPAEDLNQTRLTNLAANNIAKARNVRQRSLDGEQITIYPSAGIASNQTGVYLSGIRRCCDKKLTTAGGYKWEWC